MYFCQVKFSVSDDPAVRPRCMFAQLQSRRILIRPQSQTCLPEDRVIPRLRSAARDQAAFAEGWLAFFAAACGKAHFPWPVTPLQPPFGGEG